MGQRAKFAEIGTKQVLRKKQKKRLKVRTTVSHVRTSHTCRESRTLVDASAEVGVKSETVGELEFISQSKCIDTIAGGCNLENPQE